MSKTPLAQSIAEARKPLVFISYARADGSKAELDHELNWLAWIKKHFAPLEKVGLVEYFADEDVQAGQDWEARILAALAQCDLFILLVSPSALASDFIIDVEVKNILERQKVNRSTESPILLPIMILPVDDRVVRRYNWLNISNRRPPDGKALSDFFQMPGRDERSREMARIVGDVSDLIEKLAEPRSDGLGEGTLSTRNFAERRLTECDRGVETVRTAKDERLLETDYGVKLEGDLVAYRESILRRTINLDWWNEPISLVARTPRGLQDPRHYVSEWCESKEASHLAIIGDAGSGKSGLLLWAATELAKRPDAIPLFVPTAKLRSSPEIDLAFLIHAARPPISATLIEPLQQTHRFVVLLDGLDELAGIDLGGETIAANVIVKVMTCLPPGTRVLASCRKLWFPKLEKALLSELPTPAEEDDDDLYRSVIRKATGTADPLEIVEIGPVPRSEALAFLQQSVSAVTLEGLSSDRRWDRFLTSPILLLLLKSGLPSLIEANTPALDRVYALYVRQALIRTVRGIREHEIAAILHALKKYSNILDQQIDGPPLSAAVRCGILLQEEGHLAWAHYTLWEYFFAALLEDEILKFSSDTIAHIDLVNGYHINRLLVPMLNRALLEKGPQNGGVSPVSPDEYIEFLHETGWRARTGYGLHPSVAKSSDGISSASFAYDQGANGTFHEDARHGLGKRACACQLSWYDAAAFANFVQARLPTSHELVAAGPEGDNLFWCADWKTEQFAHVCAYDSVTREVVGLNPDVRLARSALAIVR